MELKDVKYLSEHLWWDRNSEICLPDTSVSADWVSTHFYILLLWFFFLVVCVCVYLCVFNFNMSGMFCGEWYE